MQKYLLRFKLAYRPAPLRKQLILLSCDTTVAPTTKSLLSLDEWRMRNKARKPRSFLLRETCVAVSVRELEQNSHPVSACKISVPRNGETGSTDCVLGIQFGPFQLHHPVSLPGPLWRSANLARPSRAFLVSPCGLSVPVGALRSRLTWRPCFLRIRIYWFSS